MKFLSATDATAAATVAASTPTSTDRQKSNYVSELLTSNNYLTLVQEAKYALDDEGCRAEDNTVPGEPTFNVTSTPKTYRILLRSVEQVIRLSLLAYQTDPEMWIFLYKKYSGKNTSRKIDGTKSIALFRYRPGTVASNFERIRKLVLAAHIAAGRKSITFEELGVAMFLNSLPNRFAATRAILETSAAEATMQTAQNALTAEEQRLGLRDTPRIHCC
jgi:hypothetical protein